MTKPPAGGAFLVEDADPAFTLTPEFLSEEALFMARSVEDFVQGEVVPVADEIEAQQDGLMDRLLRQAGEAGLLGIAVPEMYGGLDLPKSTILLLTERMAVNLPFAISAGVHSGVSLLPLLFFGTAEQKRRYLPGLASGEDIGAFALSEADSGSDALSARTRAVLSSDGSYYLLNGEKMWITNGGFADLFTVFAKVNGEQFTAFLVDRNTPGLTVGREEHKLGLHGSSTRRITFENAGVPIDNLLGEQGKGHRPALGALNLGRVSIAATALGACKTSLQIATRYAAQRKQFGRPISEFGLIQHKLAEMAVRTFVLESMIYRIGGYWDDLFGTIDPTAEDAGDHFRAAAEEYSIESALIKFFGTEVMAYVVDEALQIHGGFGYSEEFPMARIYRDARVFRIFEGANEINRLTAVDQIIRRIERGRLPIYEALSVAASNLAESSNSAEELPMELLAVRQQVRRLRVLTLNSLIQAQSALGERFMERQEIPAALAEMAVTLYGLESVYLRCHRLVTTDKSEKLAAALAVAQIFGDTGCAYAQQQAQTLFTNLAESGVLNRHLDAIDLLFKAQPIDTIAVRRNIAARVIEHTGYCW